MTRALTYVEIDVPSFVETSPETTSTYRFAQDVGYLPDTIEAIPSIVSVSFSPARISLGENLGERASLTIAFRDHRHIMAGEDYDSGTFWGKWRGRYGTRLRGRSVRWITGTTDQTLAEMTTNHFIVDSVSGPTPQGVYTIVAKDILKIADGDRAQAPVLSQGFCTGNVTAAVNATVTLNPAGIGDSEYPTTGYVAIGGEEICEFTRLDSPESDTLTLITRGEFGTTAQTHEAGDRVQLVLYYQGEDPADIIYDLLVNYAGIDASYIPLSTWQTETAAYLNRLYTAVIAEPVSINKLLSEIIEQAALALWWDPVEELLRLRVLRQISTESATFSEDNTLRGSLTAKEQPATRISQIWTYFGQRNPLEPLDEPNNYRSCELTVDLEAETDYGSAAIKKIYSRWIPFGGRDVATRLNTLLMSRYVDPPRKFTLKTFRHGEIQPQLGSGYYLTSWSLQESDGTPDTVPTMITRLNARNDAFEIEAEEMIFTDYNQTDLTDRVIIIDSDINNIDLKTLHDSIYPEITGLESPAQSLTVYITSGVIVGSDSAGEPAFDVGSWPVGFPITIYVRGRIQGKGGDGGRSAEVIGYPGEAGGVALYTRYAVDLILNEGDGEIYGGGGGGGGGHDTATNGGGGGGGGAGKTPGNGGSGYGGGEAGEAGTTEAGGLGGDGISPPKGAGGDGGDPGQSGEAGDGTGGVTGGAGGTAGNAIDGVSYVTKTGVGDIQGGEVN